MFKTFLFFIFSCISLSGFAQNAAAPPQTKDEFEKNYQWRIQQSSLSGVYIPKDLFDAIKQLNRLTDSTSRLKFKLLTETEAEHKLFFSLNRWIVLNWGLYEGSRLGAYLKEYKVSFPEDQATAIIICWHRTLNGKEINFKEISTRMFEKRKKEREEELKKATIIEEKILPAKKNNDAATTKN